MAMSSYDAWVTREPDWHSGADLPEDCLICGKALALNNTCGVCYRKECRDEMKQRNRDEIAYEKALSEQYEADAARYAEQEGIAVPD
jgi:hypothetical protein